jgi:hypothetical protein
LDPLYVARVLGDQSRQALVLSAISDFEFKLVAVEDKADIVAIDGA